MDVCQVRWAKSTYSGPETNCVEVAFVPGEVGVRDSKNPAAGAIVLPERAWRAFAGPWFAGERDAGGTAQ